MTGEVHECFVFESRLEGTWEKTRERKVIKEGSFLLRRGRKITHVLFVGILPSRNVGNIDYRSLVSCNFL